MDGQKTQEELLEKIAELERENDYFKRIFEAFPVNVFVKDTDCRYTMTSRVCDELNGAERGGLIGKTDFELRNNREIAQSLYEDDQYVMNEKIGTHMLSPTLEEDVLRYFDIYKEPILDDDKNVIGLVGLVIDSNSQVLVDDKTHIFTDQYLDDYNNENNLMMDYDLTTNEGILLSKPDEFSYIPDRLSNPSETLREMGYLDDENAALVHTLVLKVQAGSNKCSCVMKYYDDAHNQKTGIIHVTPLFDKEGHASHAICVIRTIPEDHVLDEKKKIIMQDVNSRFFQLMTSVYERVVYVSPMRDWYQVLKNNADNQIKDNGSYEEIKEFWQAALSAQEFRQFQNLFFNRDLIYKGKRPGINTFRSKCKAADGTVRWKEITVFAQPCEDDESAFIVAIADIEDDVQEENRLKRHIVNKQVIDILSTIVEYRDLESGEHIRRIQALSELLLREYSSYEDTESFTDDEIKIISAASAMHDIGKIAISDTILLKPGKLTREEFENMKEHTVKGSEMIRTVASIQDKEYAKYCYEICRYHHERYDGKGYPEGLVGDQIPISAQIVSVADVYDALVSKRCYKNAYSKELAYEMIMNGECGTFSEKVLRCFVNCRESIEALYK